MRAVMSTVARKAFSVALAAIFSIQYSPMSQASPLAMQNLDAVSVQTITEPRFLFDVSSRQRLAVIKAIILQYKAPADVGIINLQRSVNGGPFLGGHVRGGDALLPIDKVRAEVLPATSIEDDQVNVEFRRNDFGQFPRVFDPQLTLVGETADGKPASVVAKMG